MPYRSLSSGSRRLTSICSSICGAACSARVPATDQKRYLEPLSLQNYYWSRRYHSRDDLRLLDEDDAIGELELDRRAGGVSVVDATSIGLGRDPLALARIARASGVNIVMGCGYYLAPYQPPSVAEASVDSLAEEMIRDVREGVADTGIRSGVIGEIGMSWPPHDDETKVLRAAVIAQAETGAPLMIHPGRDEHAPLSHMDIVDRGGGDTTRTIMSHVDRTLFHLDDICRLAETGCYIEFDLFGQESSYYSLAPIDMPNDARRIDLLLGMIGRGYLQQLLIAQDICHKTNLVRYGGEGYAHILENVVPVMRRKGMSSEQIEAITIKNPARVLARPR